MKASLHFTNSAKAGGCNLCTNLKEHLVMSVMIHSYEIRTCEKCLPEMFQALQGLVFRLETISKKLPKNEAD